jgi:hypothetical protein
MRNGDHITKHAPLPVPAHLSEHMKSSLAASPPWSIEDIGAAFVVKDANGQKLAYV